MTQPAPSRSLGRLERELGVSLLERAGRNVRMTRYGEAFLPYVDHGLRALEEGRRIGFLFTLGVEGRTIDPIWMKDRYLPASTRAFRDYVIASRNQISQGST